MGKMMVIPVKYMNLFMKEVKKTAMSNLESDPIEAATFSSTIDLIEAGLSILARPESCVSMDELIQYIELAFNTRPHTDSRWYNEKGECQRVDVGYAQEWWNMMRQELIRVFELDPEAPEVTP